MPPIFTFLAPRRAGDTPANDARCQRARQSGDPPENAGEKPDALVVFSIRPRFARRASPRAYIRRSLRTSSRVLGSFAHELVATPSDTTRSRFASTFSRQLDGGANVGIVVGVFGQRARSLSRLRSE